MPTESSHPPWPPQAYTLFPQTRLCGPTWHPFKVAGPNDPVGFLQSLLKFRCPDGCYLYHYYRSSELLHRPFRPIQSEDLSKYPLLEPTCLELPQGMNVQMERISRAFALWTQLATSGMKFLDLLGPLDDLALPTYTPMQEPG